MSTNINLLAEKKRSLLAPYIKQIKLMRLFAMSLLFGISVSSVVLYMLISLSPLPQLQQQKQNQVKTLATYHPDMAKIEIINERSNAISKIMTNRAAIDTTLDTVLDIMPAGLSITAFTLSKEGILITVTGASLTAIDQFLNNLIQLVDENKVFSKVTLTDLSIDEKRSAYILSIHLLSNEK